MNKKMMDVNIAAVTEEVFAALELQEKIMLHRFSVDYSEGRDDILQDALNVILESHKFNQLENELFDEILSAAQTLTASIDKYVNKFMREVSNIEVNTTNDLCLFANGYVGRTHDTEAQGQAAIFSLRTDWDNWKDSNLANNDGSFNHEEYLDFAVMLAEEIEYHAEQFIENWVDWVEF